MVQKALDRVSEAVPGCDVVAYADLSTQMVLVTNSNCTLARDALNQLCAQAQTVLATGMQAFCGTDADMRVFMRNPSDATEAICCQAGSDVDVGALMAALGSCFESLSEANAT